MRLRAGPAAAALLGAIGLAAPVRAQSVDGRASVMVSGAYNKTLTDAPYPTSQTQSGPSVSIGPSGTLLVDSPRTTNTFTGTLSLALPFSNELQVVDTPLTYSAKLAYSGRFMLSERSTMTAGASFGYTPLNSLLSSGDPTQTPVESIPAGAAYTLNFGVTEGFTRQLTEGWSITQAASFSYTDPIDPFVISARAYTTQGSVTCSRRFSRDTVGLSATGSYNYFTDAQGSDGGVTPGNTQLTDALALTWMHPWTEAFTMNVNLGLTQVTSPAAAIPTAVEPTGLLGLTYRLDLTSLTLQYSHQASPNLTSGSVAFTDSVTARFSVPFGTTGLTTSGSSGFTHSVPIGGNGTMTPGSPTNVIVGDVALSYRPVRVPTLTVSTRAQLQRQVATDDPSSGFTRLAVSLSLTYSYPSANAAQRVPSFPPPLGMTSLMPSDVIGTDRLGAEPEAPPEEAAPPTAP